MRKKIIYSLSMLLITICSCFLLNACGKDDPYYKVSIAGQTGYEDAVVLEFNNVSLENFNPNLKNVDEKYSRYYSSYNNKSETNKIKVYVKDYYDVSTLTIYKDDKELEIVKNNEVSNSVSGKFILFGECAFGDISKDTTFRYGGIKEQKIDFQFKLNEQSKPKKTNGITQETYEKRLAIWNTKVNLILNEFYVPTNDNAYISPVLSGVSGELSNLIEENNDGEVLYTYHANASTLFTKNNNYLGTDYIAGLPLKNHHGNYYFKDDIFTSNIIKPITTQYDNGHNPITKNFDCYYILDINTVSKTTVNVLELNINRIESYENYEKLVIIPTVPEVIEILSSELLSNELCKLNTLFLQKTGNFITIKNSSGNWQYIKSCDKPTFELDTTLGLNYDKIKIFINDKEIIKNDFTITKEEGHVKLTITLKGSPYMYWNEDNKDKSTEYYLNITGIDSTKLDKTNLVAIKTKHSNNIYYDLGGTYNHYYIENYTEGNVNNNYQILYYNKNKISDEQNTFSFSDIVIRSVDDSDSFFDRLEKNRIKFRLKNGDKYLNSDGTWTNESTLVNLGDLTFREPTEQDNNGNLMWCDKICILDNFIIVPGYSKNDAVIIDENLIDYFSFHIYYREDIPSNIEIEVIYE